MDHLNSEPNVTHEIICANISTESTNEQNQSENASESCTTITKSEDTQVNINFNLETLKHTIKLLKSTTKNAWLEYLTRIWNMAINILKRNSDESSKAIQFTVKCTLDLMLMNEWIDENDKSPLRNKINECIPLLQKYPNMSYRCKYIIDNMDNFWSHPIFKRISKYNGGTAPDISEADQLNEEIEFFAIERGCMIEMRAQKLIENGKCDDIAINFLSHAIQAINACVNDHLLRQTVSCRQLQSLLECHLSLLYKAQQMDKLKRELESMHLKTIRDFIVNSVHSIADYATMNPNKYSSLIKEHDINDKKQRKKNKKRKRTWIEILLGHHISVSKYAVQFVLVRILNDGYKSDNSDEILEELLRIWMEQNRSEENFDELFRTLVRTANDNRKIYKCCECFHRLFPKDCEAALQVFCKTLTIEINELENKKFDFKAEASTLLSVEKEISDRYLWLVNFLHSYSEKRDCILTAFSMNPTQSNFDLVCQFSDESFSGSGNPNTMPLSSESLKSDLKCLLRQPRIKDLCWSSPWPELKKECQELLQTEKKIKILENSTATANDNLKYIELNYDAFEDFRPHEYPSIEKGYEMYIPDSSDSDSRSNVKNRDRDSDDTDTAPESEKFISEEREDAKRMRRRKRSLIRRSQKKLADSGSSDTARRRRVKKETQNDVIDGSKPKRFRRSNIHKKTIKSETDTIQATDPPKEAFIIMSKAEPIEFPHQFDEQPISTEDNFSIDLLTTEIEIKPKEEVQTDANERFQSNKTIPEIKIEEMNNDIQIEIDVNTENDSENDDSSVQTVIFGNEINDSVEVSSTENQTTNDDNNTNEYLDGTTPLQNVQNLHVQPGPIMVNRNNYGDCPDEQRSKPKNPLLSFRKPKKQSQPESIQQDNETVNLSSDLSTVAACISHYSDCSMNKNEPEIPCEMEMEMEMEMDNFRNHRTEHCIQDTTKDLPNVDNSEEETHTKIVILTKHCTVRLQRISDQLLKQSQHHSIESDVGDESDGSIEFETPSDAEYCENDINIIGEQSKNDDVRETSNEPDGGVVEVNSNIMYDCPYQNNDDFNDSSLNSLSNQSSAVLNGYENDCNGQEKLQEIHEAMAKVEDQSKESEELDQFQSVSMSDTQQQCMKHVQFHCMSIRINYSNRLSNMFPLSTHLEQCQTFAKKAYGLEALHQNQYQNVKTRITRPTNLIRLCINNICEWFLLKLPLPVTHIIIIYAKNEESREQYQVRYHWTFDYDKINVFCICSVFLIVNLVFLKTTNVVNSF